MAATGCQAVLLKLQPCCDVQQAEIAKAQGKENEVKVYSDTLFLFFFPRWALGKLEYTRVVPSKSRAKFSYAWTQADTSQPERGLHDNKYQKKKDVTKQVNINIQCFPVYCISFSPPPFTPLWRQRIVVWKRGNFHLFCCIKAYRKVWKCLGFWKLLSIFRTVTDTESVSWRSFMVTLRWWLWSLWILRESSWVFISFQQLILSFQLKRC